MELCIGVCMLKPRLELVAKTWFFGRNKQHNSLTPIELWCEHSSIEEEIEEGEGKMCPYLSILYFYDLWKTMDSYILSDCVAFFPSQNSTVQMPYKNSQKETFVQKILDTFELVRNMVSCVCAVDCSWYCVWRRIFLISELNWKSSATEMGDSNLEKNKNAVSISNNRKKATQTHAHKSKCGEGKIERGRE